MTAVDAFLQARDFLLAHRDDYETAYQAFRWPKLEQFNWALDYFDILAKDNPNIALWVINEAGGESQLSFAEVAERSNRIANFLRSLGVQRGDPVLVMLNNVVPLWETMLAIIKLGAVIIPTTTLLTPEDLTDRLGRGRVRHVVVGVQETGKFAALPGDYTRLCVGGAVAGWTALEEGDNASAQFTPDGLTQASDPLLLYFTSGTTSRPKLVEHTHQSYPVGHLSTMYWLGLKPGDVHLNISSPGWAKHAWSCFFAPWNAGATVFVYHSARFDTQAMLDVIVRAQVTTLCAPPTVWRMLIQENLAAYPLKVRELCSAGEPLNPEVIERVQKAWGITIRDGYGQTETTCQIGNTPGQPVKLGSMGRPLPGYQIVLLDHDDKEVQEGEIGCHLDPHPLGLMVGYQDDRAKTVDVMRNGYYHSGDVARRDADGYYTYVGRTDDVFKASDYRISPFELESVLIEHEAVAEAAVVPSPDPLRLAVPKAFVSLRGGFEPSAELAQSILRYVREHVAPYQRIRRIEFAELPKTISGKIRRVELRRLESERQPEAERRKMEFWEEDLPGVKSLR